MRAPLFAVAGVAGLVFVSSYEVAPGATTLAVVPVAVEARCAGAGNSSVSVDPVSVHVAQGDEVAWTLTPGSNGDQYTIFAKETQPDGSPRWPFAAGAHPGTKANPARANGMRPNARGTYSYGIRLICQIGQGPPDTVVVDPDVIVD